MLQRQVALFILVHNTIILSITLYVSYDWFSQVYLIRLLYLICEVALLSNVFESQRSIIISNLIQF